MKLVNSRYIKALIFPLILFFMLLPVSLLVNYHQNDDWCYYLTVQNFLSGNFTLHPYVGPTFYLQGIAGMVFAKLFGLQHLPVLNLLAACVSVYFLILILGEFFNQSLKRSIIYSLIYFLNPLGVYELWGFMNNHYFMMFLLPAFYFFLKYDKFRQKKYLICYVLIVLAGLLVRQTALVLPLSAVLLYFVRKEYKLSIFNFSFFGALYLFYSKILPLTPRIAETPLRLQHFLKFDYSYAIIYGTILVLAAYLFPLVLNSINLKEIYRNKKLMVVFALVFILLFFGLNKIYKPQTISWGEFPYFENTFERTGFYPRGISGTKYYFSGNFDLWWGWDLISKISLAAFVAYSIVFRKIKVNIFSAFIVVYMGLMIVTETYFDRYIFPLIPVIMFYLLSVNERLKNYTKVFLAGFVLVLAFLAYLFSADFILVNNYVWNRSISLVQNGEAARDRILGNNAWQLEFNSSQASGIYVFSYDSQSVNDDLKKNYELIESHKIKFPLDIYVKPVIYLYKRITI